MLVKSMNAAGTKRITSEQAVEALGDGRITSPKQLADALRPLNIAPKDIRIGGRHLRGYSLEVLVNYGNATLATPATDPKGNGEGRTCGIVENKGVSPQNEKIVHTSEKGGVDTSPEPRQLDFDKGGAAAEEPSRPGAKAAQTTVTEPAQTTEVATLRQGGGRPSPEPQDLDFDHEYTAASAGDADAPTKSRYGWEDL